MRNIVIPDQEKLDEIKTVMAASGAAGMHVLADFDRTLTRAFVDGQKVDSIISVLRDGSYLTPDYAKRAQALHDIYYEKEVDADLPLPEKKKEMEKWWRAHFELLIECGLNKKDLERVMTSSRIQFRDGTLEFLDYLHEQNIPLVIVSSSGLGEEIISMFLRKHGRMYGNIHIVANAFEWDDDGRATAVKEPIIHVANKDETTLEGRPFYPEIEQRRNVILLGDNIEDNGMVTGFAYDNLLRVGFLNENVDKNLPQYENNFEVVVTHDGDMSFVNELVRECVEDQEGNEASRS